MLPKRHRLSESREFATTIKRGTRVSRRDVVIHMHVAGARQNGEAPLHNAGFPVATTGPRVGLVVSKSVGNAVTRHRVARALRHAVVPALVGLDDDVRIVLRARPSAATADVASLTPQLIAGITQAWESRAVGSRHCGSA